MNLSPLGSLISSNSEEMNKPPPNSSNVDGNMTFLIFDSQKFRPPMRLNPSGNSNLLMPAYSRAKSPISVMSAGSM